MIATEPSFDTEPGYPTTAVMSDVERQRLDDMLKNFDRNPSGFQGQVNIKTNLASVRFATQAFYMYGEDAVQVHDSLIVNMHPDIAARFSQNFLKHVIYMAIEESKERN